MVDADCWVGLVVIVDGKDVLLGNWVVVVSDVAVIGPAVVVVVSDGSLLFVVVVVVMGLTVEDGPVTEGGIIVVLTEGIVVVLGMVVGTDDVLLDETKVVVVSDGASVVEDVRVVVGQCPWGSLPWQ